MAAGDVDVRIIESLDSSTIDTAVTASIAATSNDAGICAVPINMGKGLVFISVARS